MLNFLPLGLDSVEQTLPFFKNSHTHACDNTVGGTYMWRDFFGTEYAISGCDLIFRVDFPGVGTAFAAPLCMCGDGCECDSAFEKIFEYCSACGTAPVICMAAEQDCETMKKAFVLKAVPEPDWSDYLYGALDLSELAGKKYSGQRNHIHAFLRENPDYSFESISPENLAEVSEFFKAFERRGDKTSPLYLAEREKIFEVFSHWNEYRQQGIVLRLGASAGKRIAAFAFGELLGDTLYVHVEKADADVRGAYPMIVSQFARIAVEGGAEFINREDDAGDAGLRTSKLSYHPVSMVNKYTVTILGRR